MPTIFVAGIYGVGKSTLCDSLSTKTGIPQYSAGDLISQVNGETYGINKVVKNKIKNQDILTERVAEILNKTERIILAGHFCIVNKSGGIDNLPSSVFENLQIIRIILLESEIESIITNLGNRDGKLYTTALIAQLLQRERRGAEETVKRLKVPLHIYQMQYTPLDAERIISWL